MRRAPALFAFAMLAASACEGKFEFDADSSISTGGMGVGGFGAGGQGGVATSSGGSSGAAGAVALDCKSRCQAAGLVCLNPLQLCVECVETEDCASRGGGRCGVSGQAEHRCLGCLSNEDCALGQQCDAGTHTCVTTCTHFGDDICTDGLVCNPWRFYCAACYDADDCQDLGLRCSVGDARCVQCVDDDECDTQPGKLCDPVALRCVVCRDSFDCPAGRPICDPVAHTCH